MLFYSVILCFTLSPKRKGWKKTGVPGGGGIEVGRVSLPNSDLISEPEHAVCEDATRCGVAPVLPVGWLAL